MAGRKKTTSVTKQQNSKNSTTPLVPYSRRVPDLSNLQAARNEAAELIKAFHARRINDDRARTLAYLYQVFLSYLKVEAEIEWTKKLDRIEKYFQEVMNHGIE